MELGVSSPLLSLLEMSFARVLLLDVIATYILSACLPRDVGVALSRNLVLSLFVEDPRKKFGPTMCSFSLTARVSIAFRDVEE